MSAQPPAPASAGAPDEPVERKPIPAWIAVGGILLAAMLFFGLLAGVFLVVELSRKPPKTAGQEFTMADGTILTLEKVTFGQQHAFDVPGSSGGFFPWDRPYAPAANAYTQNPALVVWLTRRDGATGRALDLDTWSYSTAVDENGWTVEDDQAGRDAYSNRGSEGTGGSRPFSPLSNADYDTIVAHSALPPVRGQTFKLRLHDTSGNVMAEFNVPNPAPGPYPTWQPQPLPATQADGDLSVTLTSLGATPAQVYRGSRLIEGLRIEPQFEMAQRGAATGDWYGQVIDVQDALGNSSATWDCRLSPRESAWKLNVKLFRRDTASFEPAEECSLPDVAFPGADKSEGLNSAQTAQGVTLRFLATGGPGTVTHFNLASANFQGSYGSNGGSGKTSHEIDTTSNQASNVTTVKCQAPHLALRAEGMSGDFQLTAKAVDDQGRAVPLTPAMNADIYFWFVDPPEGAKTVTFKFVVQKSRNVTFLVQPPAANPPAAQAPAEGQPAAK